MFVSDYTGVAQAALELPTTQNSASSGLAVSQNGNGANLGAPASPRALKLRQAAAEFEGLLISSLWKSMKSSFSSPDDDDSTDPAHDTLNDLSIDTMSNAVAKAGGLGLGKLILKHLEPMLATSQPENSPSSSGKDSASSADYLCSGGSPDPSGEER